MSKLKHWTITAEGDLFLCAKCGEVGSRRLRTVFDYARLLVPTLVALGVLVAFYYRHFITLML